MTPRLAVRCPPRVAGLLGAFLALACDRRGPMPSAPEVATSETAGSPAVAPPPASRIEREGLSIAFSLLPQRAAATSPEARSDATAVFTITDAKTGAPVRGLSPNAWMSRRAGAPPDDAGCQEKIKSHMAGLLSVRPDVDMNAYLLWTLNDDNTLSVINPQIAFGKTKLRNLVTLAGTAASFALHPDRGTLYVTLPGRRALAIVDTRRSLVTANVPVGARPERVAVAPDGKTVWVGNDGDDTVSVVDAAVAEVRKTLRVGPGHHEIAFAGGGRTAWITSRDAGVVTVVDTGTLEPLGEVAVGEGAASVAASDAAGAVHVANEARGEMVILDAERRTIAGRVPTKRGVDAIRFEPKGRFSFALNPSGDEVLIFDASTGKLAHALSGFSAPDAIEFSDAFAYVRSLGEGKVSLIDLRSLERPGTPAVVRIPIGQGAPRTAPAAAGAPIAVAPEGNGAIVANPADRALYYYVEGMMAPLGTFSNHGRSPRSALIEDRSLKEVRPGVYSTTVRLAEEGVHDVELLLGSPRIAACLQATVAPSPTASPEAAPSLVFEPLFGPDADIAVSTPVTLRFRVAEKAPARPIESREMKVMIIRFPQGFRFTTEPRAEEDGSFSVTFSPPEPGRYRFLLQAERRNAPFGALPFVDLHASAPAPSLDPGGAR